MLGIFRRGKIIQGGSEGKLGNCAHRFDQVNNSLAIEGLTDEDDYLSRGVES